MPETPGVPRLVAMGLELYQPGQNKFRSEMADILEPVQAVLTQALEHTDLQIHTLATQANQAWTALNNNTPAGLTSLFRIRESQATRFVNALRNLRKLQPENDALNHLIPLVESTFCDLPRDAVKKLDNFFATFQSLDDAEKTTVSVAAKAWSTFKTKKIPAPDQQSCEYILARKAMRTALRSLLELSCIPEDIKEAARSIRSHTPEFDVTGQSLE